MAELNTNAPAVAHPAAVPTGLAQAMAVVTAMGAGDPTMQWSAVDDRCDCTFQRVGFWTNPYLGETLEVRLCCAWAYLFAQFPAMAEFQHVTKAYVDPNTGRVHHKPLPWDSDEADMQRAIWYRQLANEQGRPLTEIRAAYAALEPPRRVPPKQQ